MADFFAKGNKPISAYGGVEHGWYTVWENSNPSASFGAQNVEIQSDLNIDAFEIAYSESGYSESVAQGVVGDHLQALYFVLSGAGKIIQKGRDCTISKSGNTYTFAFSDAKTSTLNTYASAPTQTTTNTAVVPQRILALIHND